MISAIRASILKRLSSSSPLKTAFFHSTPILQRKYQSNSKARNKNRVKQELRRNGNAFAEHLFGIWSDGFDYSGCFGFRGGDDGYDFDYILRSALGGSRGRQGWNFSWSNTHEDKGHRSGNRSSWNSRYRLDEEEEEEKENEYSSTESNQESHRQTLGLSSSGPLNLEDVKIAYRACALKWHPDRHHSSTKNEAGEKFKLCTVAYQSLCEKLAMN